MFCNFEIIKLQKRDESPLNNGRTGGLSKRQNTMDYI